MPDTPRAIRRQPRRDKKHRTVAVHLWSDTDLALQAYAAGRGLYLSGAAHALIREGLGLSPITETTITPK